MNRARLARYVSCVSPDSYFGQTCLFMSYTFSFKEALRAAFLPTALACAAKLDVAGSVQAMAAAFRWALNARTLVYLDVGAC